MGKTAVTLSTGGGVIPGCAGEARGGNLFHSFEKFDVGQEATVTFTPQAGATTNNIIARVTGKEASTIDGTIRSTIPNASLYLMNPSGLIFGSHASLDIKGSFFATTADHINLGPKASFAAAGGAIDPTLTMPPSGFGFSGAKTTATSPPGLKPPLLPGEIRLDGAHLTGARGSTLGFVGKRVTIKGGTLDADRGEVKLAAVVLGTLRTSNAQGLPVTQAIPGSHGGTIAVSATDVGYTATDPSDGISRVSIFGGSLVMNKSRIRATLAQPGDVISVALQQDLFMNQSRFAALVQGNFEKRTAIGINARNALLKDISVLLAQHVDLGSGGNLHLTLSGQLVSQGGRIQVRNDNSTVGGDIVVKARRANLDGGSITSVNAAGAASGAYLVSVGEDLTLRNGGLLDFIASRGKMKIEAGSLTLRGTGPSGSSRLTFDDAQQGANGGVLEVDVRHLLTLEGGTFIRATADLRGGRKIDISAGDILLSGSGTAPDAMTGIIGSVDGPAGVSGGDINLRVRGAVKVLDGATISSNTAGASDGGNISIQADELIVTGRAQTPGTFVNPRGITAQNENSIGGSSGNVDLRVRKLKVSDEGEVNTGTMGSGPGGSIVIHGEQAEVSQGGRIVAETSGTDPRGLGGDVEITLARTLDVDSAGSVSVSTFGGAPGGNLTVRCDSVLLAGSGSELAARSGRVGLVANGPGGDVMVDAGKLEIADGGMITASTFGTMHGGDVRVNAGRLSIHVNSSASETTGISVQALARDQSGSGGEVEVHAKHVELDGSAATIASSTSGQGAAGAIRLRSATLQLRNGSSIQSSSAGEGAAGTVVIDVGQNVSLRDGSSISVASDNSSAGDIQIHAGDTISLVGSRITAAAKLTGGNIRLQAGNLLYLRQSRLTAAAQSSGGNIDIDPQFVVLDQSLIDARAKIISGGNIHIVSAFYLPTPESLVTATSDRGIDGEVVIDAFNINLIGSLIELSTKLLDAESMLQELCTMKLENFNSFVKQGRGGLPPWPGGPIPSTEIIP